MQLAKWLKLPKFPQISSRQATKYICYCYRQFLKNISQILNCWYNLETRLSWHSYELVDKNKSNYRSAAAAAARQATFLFHCFMSFWRPIVKCVIWYEKSIIIAFIGAITFKTSLITFYGLIKSIYCIKGSPKLQKFPIIQYCVCNGDRC